MFIRNPFQGAFGLDIGDLSIKLIQLKPKWHYKNGDYFEVSEMRSISLPPGYIVDGEIQQPEMVRKKIIKLLEKTETKKAIKCPWVVADLPEPKSFLKVIELDIPKNEITNEDVEFQAKKHLPIDSKDAYFDWQIIGSSLNNGGTKILIGAAAKNTTDIYTYLLESVGLSPLALEFEGVSIARALITAEKNYTGEARTLLDLGATRSSLIIYDQETIQFTQNLNFSGEIFTTALAQELKIEHSKAEKLKIENGLVHNKKYPKYIKIASQMANNLAKEIDNALEFYYNHFNNTNKITRITMCGGLANLKNLSQVLTQKLKIESAPGKPWKNLAHPDLKYFSNIDGLPYVSAIGLALRAVNSIEFINK